MKSFDVKLSKMKLVLGPYMIGFELGQNILAAVKIQAK